jgi:malate/lactate dehydrogenase
MSYSAFPLLPHEIDQLPIRDRILASFETIREEELLASEDEEKRLASCIETLRNTIENILLRVQGFQHVAPAERQVVINTALDAVRFANFVLED